MADYRCARKYGNASLYIAIFKTKRLYEKRQIDSGASTILSLAPWRLQPTVRSITHTSRVQPLLALSLGFIFSAILQFIPRFYRLIFSRWHGNMKNESTKVQNPRWNSYAGITPCIEQQVPRTNRLCIILRMHVECLAAPCRPSPVSRLFHAGCISS